MSDTSVTSETQCMTNLTEKQEIIERAENISDTHVDNVSDDDVVDDVVVDDKESSSDCEDENSDNDDNNLITCENLKKASMEIDNENKRPVNNYENDYHFYVQISALCVICAYVGFITGIYVAHI